MPKLSAETTYRTLTSDIQALNIVVGDTQRIVATARSLVGAPLRAAPPATFRSDDPTKVQVNADGLVTAVQATDGVNIIATMTTGGVTHSDTTLVAATATRRTLKSFKLVWNDGQPAGRVNVGNYRYVTYSAIDENDLTVTSLIVAYKSLDPHLVQEYSGSFVSLAIGKTKVLVSANVFGVQWADTVELASFYPLSATTYAGETFGNLTIIGVNGTMTWWNFSYPAAPINITFTNDVDKIPGGSIASIASYELDSRSFPVAGTYNYVNTLTGAKGAVIVREQPQY